MNVSSSESVMDLCMKAKLASFLFLICFQSELWESIQYVTLNPCFKVRYESYSLIFQVRAANIWTSTKWQRIIEHFNLLLPFQRSVGFLDSRSSSPYTEFQARGSLHTYLIFPVIKVACNSVKYIL